MGANVSACCGSHTHRADCPKCSNRPKYFNALPSKILDRIYIFCFGKAIEQLPGDRIDGLCHGCAGLSPYLEHHPGCSVREAFTSRKLPVSREQIEMNVEKLRVIEGLPRPDAKELNKLWECCQVVWRPTVRGLMMHQYAALPHYWKNCI